MIGLLKNIYSRLKFDSSKNYWEKRYAKGGNSGSGSYGRLAEFKAEFINDFVAKNGVNTVIEFGCGDGNQLTLAKYPHYIGLDVSPTAIRMCIAQFKDDKSKSFFLYDQECYQDNQQLFRSDLSMSLDVIYHLVEDAVFEKYMHNLFQASGKYVIIYSSDTDENNAAHVKQRKFTTWVEKNISGWKLDSVTENKYKITKESSGTDTSIADFFVYRKV